MNEARRTLVSEAFDQLDGNGAKQVTVEDIKGKVVIKLRKLQSIESS